MQHSIPYTPQWNGTVAERKNINLKEMVICMMESKTLLPNFWGEAIKFSAYIQNRVPHKSLDGITPFESWSGHKPDVSHFNIFCSKSWDRIPPEKRKGLETQIQELIFVQYSKYSKG